MLTFERKEEILMAVYLISYDLRAPGRDYEPLYKAIKATTHCHAMDSAWLVDVNQTPIQLREAVESWVDANDVVLVTRFRSPDWAAYNLACGKWLSSPERAW